jgi:hypothetical protein
MAGDCFTPSDISDFAVKDTSRLVGSIARALAANAPFMNVIQGGTFPSGVSDEIRSTVQMQAAPGDSLAIPTFVCDTEICGTSGSVELTDTVDLIARIESKRGTGPRVCVKKGYSAFKGAYVSAEDSLKKLITQYINADVRAQLYLRSASKFVAAAGYTFQSLFTGGKETDLGVKFLNVLPTGAMSFKALSVIARHLKEGLFAEMFPAGGKSQAHFRVIAGVDQVEYFRNEANVRGDAIALTQGGYKLGETMLTAYSFESAPAYRGLAFGEDQRPLRFTGFNANGTLNLVDPVLVIPNAAKNTAYAISNPAYEAALYEVGFLIADNSFERLVPEKYVGEGSFKFAPQLHAGELNWHYLKDNDCNQWGDFGWHNYQISRAYRPIRPQWIVPFIYKRCPEDLGLTECVEDSRTIVSAADSFVTVGTCVQELQ